MRFWKQNTASSIGFPKLYFMLFRFPDLFCLPFFRQSKSNKTEEELEKRKKSKKNPVKLTK